ncbi:MAG: insulinase family protein, partial [Thermosynechococcus sp. Uc]|uniref:M16 family metallopeptidase n=1 Tax=Thermosynechococcus sp. Uc TaxID=3034853 RepID=UPI00259F70C7
LFKNAVIPGKSQAITYLGAPGIDRRDPRFYAAMLMNHILGGDTLASRLGTEIRDRQGLTYGIHSFFSATRQAGPFLIQLQTAPEDTAKAIQATLQLLREARRQGLTTAELEAAKRSLSNTYLVELANVDVLARTLLGNASVELPPEELQAFGDRLQAVTLEQVNQALQELIDPDHLVIVTAGPAVSFNP